MAETTKFQGCFRREWSHEKRHRECNRGTEGGIKVKIMNTHVISHLYRVPNSPVINHQKIHFTANVQDCTNYFAGFTSGWVTFMSAFHDTLLFFILSCRVFFVKQNTLHCSLKVKIWNMTSTFSCSKLIFYIALHKFLFGPTERK